MVSARRAAFTLTELLVTMVIGLLMIVFLFQLFNATAGAWSCGEDQNDTFREARAAMQMMVRDIGQTMAGFPQNAYSSSPTPTPSPSPSATNGTVPTLVLDHYTNPDPTPEDNGQINEEIYCLTNAPNNGASSLCAVGYFCMWMPDLVSQTDPQLTQKQASAPRAYALVRQFLGSGKPAPLISPPPSPAPTPIYGLFDRFQAVSGKSPLLFMDVYERARPPTIPSATLMPPVATCTPLASYIWDLQFRTPATLTMPGATSSAPYLAQPNPGPGYPTTLPAYVEIRFKALSARAARQLEGNNAVNPLTWSDSNVSGSSSDARLYQRLILPATRQFVARVPLGIASPVSTP